MATATAASKPTSKIEILSLVQSGQLSINDAAKLLAASSKPSGKLTFKVSEKGAVSIYGMSARFPTTLYVSQLERERGAKRPTGSALALLDVIRRIRTTTGASIVYISHDLGVVRSLVDQVVVLYGGRIAEAGSTDDIFRSPVHPYTRRLIAAVPRLDGPRLRLRGVPGSAPQPSSRVPGCPFAPRCALATDQCEHQMPPVTATPAGYVRCWHAGEPDPEMTGPEMTGPEMIGTG